jgi:hypothetical protein
VRLTVPNMCLTRPNLASPYADYAIFPCFINGMMFGLEGPVGINDLTHIWTRLEQLCIPICSKNRVNGAINFAHGKPPIPLTSRIGARSRPGLAALVLTAHWLMEDLPRRHRYKSLILPLASPVNTSHLPEKANPAPGNGT